MRSMTGYGHTERSDDRRTLSVEIRSVNNRYLDVVVSLPSYLSSLEPEIKRLVGEYALRGKIEIQVRLREYESDVSIHVDHGAVQAARRALEEIAEVAGVDYAPSLHDILSFDGVIQTETLRDPEAYRSEVISAARDALEQWNETRQVEGQVTAQDIERSLHRVRESLAVFAEAAPRVEDRVFEAVRSRFRDVLGDEAEEQRIYAEAASLMVRHATNEEVKRLSGHLDSFAEAMTEPDAIGKRLDFICQEMNREINTTGSKTVLNEVQEAVVVAKDAVEAIREQLRNVE